MLRLGAALRAATRSAHAATRSFGSTAPSLPEQARVVIVGGGIIGTSVAYHLAKLGGGHDVLLLERDHDPVTAMAEHVDLEECDSEGTEGGSF